MTPSNKNNDSESHAIVKKDIVLSVVQKRLKRNKTFAHHVGQNSHRLLLAFHK